jgi:hypothetical protein
MLMLAQADAKTGWPGAAAGWRLPVGRVLGERQRAEIARLARAGTRLPGVARGGRSTVVVTR